MPTAELIDLIRNVLTSWQTIAVTAALILYFQLVFYVAQLNRKPRSKLFARKPKLPKPPKPPKVKKEEGEEDEEEDEDEELQL